MLLWVVLIINQISCIDDQFNVVVRDIDDQSNVVVGCIDYQSTLD
jgi:hypothetical protein